MSESGVSEIKTHLQSALETLFRLKALMRLLILIDDENSLSKLREGDFIESIQYAGEIGEDLTQTVIHHVSLLELKIKEENEGTT